MTDTPPTPPTKAALLRVMDAIRNDLDALLDQLDPTKLDARVPSVLGMLHFNYHIHLRSHLDDLRKVIDTQCLVP